MCTDLDLHNEWNFCFKEILLFVKLYNYLCLEDYKGVVGKYPYLGIFLIFCFSNIIGAYVGLNHSIQQSYSLAKSEVSHSALNSIS